MKASNHAFLRGDHEIAVTAGIGRDIVARGQPVNRRFLAHGLGVDGDVSLFGGGRIGLVCRCGVLWRRHLGSGVVPHAADELVAASKAQQGAGGLFMQQDAEEDHEEADL